MPKSLNQLTSDLDKAVFLNVYYSRRQRLRRLTAVIMLLLKHMLFGLVYIWPMYVVLLGVMILPLELNHWVFMAILLPGLLVWSVIYIRGTRRDYCQYVYQQILPRGFIRNLLLN